VYAGEEPSNLVRIRSVFILIFSANMPQRDQREELTKLLRKYGGVWEPWSSELKKFKDGGKSLTGGGQ